MYGMLRVIYIYIYLEPQTTIYKWLFQLDDSQSLHRKWLFHQTSIYKWLFGVPGMCFIISTYSESTKSPRKITKFQFKKGIQRWFGSHEDKTQPTQACPAVENVHRISMASRMLFVGSPLTWRIIPNSKWLITMVSKSPKWGCSPSKWPFHGL